MKDPSLYRKNLLWKFSRKVRGEDQSVGIDQLPKKKICPFYLPLYKYEKNKRKRKEMMKDPVFKYKVYVRSANKRGRKFKLSISEASYLFSSSCFYCGFFPSDGSLNGIDRVDNEKDYITENCVPACSLCNRMKNILKLDEFLDHINKINNFEL